jgi:hypothetical protein
MRELVGPAGSAIDEETDDVAVVVVELTERGETGLS